MRKINLFKTALFCGDILLMYTSLAFSLFIRNRALLDQFKDFFYNFLILYIIWIFVIFVISLYDLNYFKKAKEFFFNLAIFSIASFFIGVTYFYFRPEFGITPKTILLINILIFDVLFFLWRYLFNLFLEARRVKEKVVIVGYYERLNEILPQIKKAYEVVSFFCPSYVDGQNKCLSFSPDIKTVSEIDDFKNVVLDMKVTAIIFALDFYSNKDLVKKIFNVLPLNINYIAIDEIYESLTKKIGLDYLDEVWFLEKISRSEDVLSKSIKRILDIVLSIIGLCIFAISFPFIAFAIKLDSNGNIFYPQQRVGKNGKIFGIYKFRTMKDRINNEESLWREKDAGSITRVGRFLRRAHIDELPQAWSIFKGDLSFVGPRPEWTEMAKEFEKGIPFYKQRYLVKPGLIGWAQINYKASKSVEEAQEKFEYDLYYIKNHSILLDLEIIFKAIKLFIF